MRDNKVLFRGRGVISYSRSQDLFEIKDLLDVVHLLLPRLSSAGVSVLPSHGAPSPAQVHRQRGGGDAGVRAGREGDLELFVLVLTDAARFGSALPWVRLVPLVCVPLLQDHVSAPAG